jgi:hypothetical protein
MLMKRAAAKPLKGWGFAKQGLPNA